MHHPVICSRCCRRFTRGVTRVRRFIVFHFCSRCQGRHAQECEQIMDKVSAFPRVSGATAACRPMPAPAVRGGAAHAKRS